MCIVVLDGELSAAIDEDDSSMIFDLGVTLWTAICDVHETGPHHLPFAGEEVRRPFGGRGGEAVSFD